MEVVTESCFEDSKTEEFSEPSVRVIALEFSTSWKKKLSQCNALHMERGANRDVSIP